MELGEQRVGEIRTNDDQFLTPVAPWLHPDRGHVTFFQILGPFLPGGAGQPFAGWLQARHHASTRPDASPVLPRRQPDESLRTDDPPKRRPGNQIPEPLRMQRPPGLKHAARYAVFLRLRCMRAWCLSEPTRMSGGVFHVE